MPTTYLQFPLLFDDAEYKVGGDYETDDSGGFWGFEITSITLDGKEVSDNDLSLEDSFRFQDAAEAVTGKAFAALQAKDYEDYQASLQEFS